MKVAILSALFAAFVAAGCNGSSSASLAAIALYKYEMHGKNGTISRGQGESLTATWDGKEVLSVKGGRLTVNGKSYGALKDGDSVLVDEDGKVSVNGVAKSPE
jgi:hypothetical protein